jgi:hypothetical protein
MVASRSARARQIAASLLVQTAVAAQSARNLAHAVGAKIKTDTGIIIADLRQRLATRVGANERHHELVGHSFVVRLLHPLHRIGVCTALGLAFDHGAVGLRDALPATVAVHRIVAAVDSGDLAGVILAHLLLQLFQIAGAIRGQSVAAIHERVHEDAIDSLLFCHFQERVQMFLPRMHAAIGDEPEQMQFAPADAGIFHPFNEHGMREELTILNHQVNARDIHMHNAPGADIQMPDFAVAHLPFGQSDERPTGVNQRVRIFAQQTVVDRFAREGDSICFGFGPVSPAVKNNENERFRTRHKSALGSWLLAVCSKKMISAGIKTRKAPVPISSVQHSGNSPHRKELH